MKITVIFNKKKFKRKMLIKIKELKQNNVQKKKKKQKHKIFTK